MTPRNLSHRLPLRLAGALCLALGANGANAGTPRGHTLVVENCDDSGPGSLRETYAAAIDGDIVDLSGLQCSRITLTTGMLVSAPDAGYVTLQGDRYRVLTLDGNRNGRVIVHAGARLGVRDLAVTGGLASDIYGGGCIYSTGDVTLLEATVSGCEVSTLGDTAKGGGIRAINGVFLGRSRVIDNLAHAEDADAEGAGIHAHYVIASSQNTIAGNSARSDGTHLARGGGVFTTYLHIEQTTLSGNEADNGAGLYLSYLGSNLTSRLVNTTISGNHATGTAGGVFGQRSLHLYNSTVAGNTAVFDVGAGIYMMVGALGLDSTIVANNSGDDGASAADLAGYVYTVVSGAHNLVIASTLVLPADTLDDDPLLEPLADNGGGVQTHALRAGSPAIDAGSDPLMLNVDERGFLCLPDGQCVLAEREVGLAADIGAFESGSPDHIFADGFEPET
ncbi:MAG: choice-of-anchor Q domain-containing protein [Rhodanobacteraceae bacterium]